MASLNTIMENDAQNTVTSGVAIENVVFNRSFGITTDNHVYKKTGSITL